MFEFQPFQKKSPKTFFAIFLVWAFEYSFVGNSDKNFKNLGNYLCNNEHFNSHSLSVCVREKEWVCVCECVWEREKVCVFMWVIERECVCLSVCGHKVPIPIMNGLSNLRNVFSQLFWPIPLFNKCVLLIPISFFSFPSFKCNKFF